MTKCGAAKNANGTFQLYCIADPMDTIAQIEQGILRCPKTKQRLCISSDRQWLVTEDNAHRYRFLDGRIPILLTYPGSTAEYASASKRMNEEYSLDEVQKRHSLFSRLKQFLN